MYTRSKTEIIYNNKSEEGSAWESNPVFHNFIYCICVFVCLMTAGIMI